MDNNRPYESNNENFTDSRTAPMTLGDWIKTYLLLMIPIVNIVLMFVWAFSSETNISKKNFFRAQLIFMGIAIVFWLLLAGCSAAFILNS